MKQNPGFWAELVKDSKPIIGLAPMDGVTDQPFRHIQKKHGNPDVMYTEFATVEGFCRGVEKPLDDFLFDETQRPIVAQIYGKNPKFFRETATVLCQLGFDGIDINMGCPAKSVANSGAGAGLIKTPKIAQEIVKETIAGVQDWVDGKEAKDCENITESIAKIVEERHENLPKNHFQKQKLQSVPVSVKTRIGFDSKIAEDWIKVLLEVNPVAIAIHGRTLREGYGGEADWDEIAKAAKVAKDQKSETLILGNGDVKTLKQAHEKAEKYGVDGVLLGRVTFGNPWVFAGMESEKVGIKERVKVALEHSKIYEETYSGGERYRFLPMRKHLGWYIKGFDKAKEVRRELMQTQSFKEAREVLKKFGLV